MDRAAVGARRDGAVCVYVCVGGEKGGRCVCVCERERERERERVYILCNRVCV